jgi:hypothetical protein
LIAGLSEGNSNPRPQRKFSPASDVNFLVTRMVTLSLGRASRDRSYALYLPVRSFTNTSPVFFFILKLYRPLKTVPFINDNE